MPEQIPIGATFSKFTPPANTGLGFLDAVPDNTILSLSDEHDADGQQRELRNETAVNVAGLLKASTGDTRSYRLLLDTLELDEGTVAREISGSMMIASADAPMNAFWPRPTTSRAKRKMPITIEGSPLRTSRPSLISRATRCSANSLT